MSLLIFVFVFILGTIIGSFLNVVIYRFNTGRTMVSGRSICMTCNKNLRWYELIPVFSFFIQSGKCRRCKSKISSQYPVVEFITGMIFTLIVFKFSPILYISYNIYLLYTILFVFIFSLLMVISVYDIRHKVVPDKLVYTFIAVSFLSVFISPYLFGPILIIPKLQALISGPIVAIPFLLVWIFSKGRLIGLGDVKLMLGIGWMLGLSQGIFSIILSFWIGTIVSLLIMFFSNKKLNMKTEIPFAPFLIISTFITFLFNWDMFSLVNLFNR